MSLLPASSLSQEQKQNLHNLGYTEYEPIHLSKVIDPHSKMCIAFKKTYSKVL